MNREFLKGIEGLSDEAIEKIIAEHGKALQKEQSRSETLKADLSEAKATIQTLTTEAEALKANGANAEEWQKKFETLNEQIKAEKAQAEADRAAKEKTEAIKSRFEAVSIDKDGKPLKWAHEAVGKSYLSKFTEALNDKANEGKSDAEIFHALTKDDKAAFENVTTAVLRGGVPIGSGGDSLDEFYKGNPFYK